MDNATSIYYAKQALLFASSVRADTVLYGSCAADLYLPACMRFGTVETQDIDLFLVADDATPPHSRVLDDFLSGVAELLDATPDALVAPASLLWSVNMTSNSLLCAHVYVNRCHFGDVTLIPARLNCKFETAYPREWANLYLSAFRVLVSHRVISLHEVIHRMSCTAGSMQLLDGLPCVPRQYNKPAIIKNTQRLWRLRILNDMGVVRARPSSWVFDIDHEFNTMQDVLPSGSEGGAALTTGGNPRRSKAEPKPEPEPDAELGPDVITLPTISIAGDVTCHMATQLRSLFDACSGALFATLATINARVSALDAKMCAIEHAGSRLAMRLNCSLQRSTAIAHDALKAAAGIVTSLRTATYLTGSKPILALKRVMSIAHERILPVLSRKHVGYRTASVGDYLEANERIAREMAEQSYLPFNLIPENMAPAKTSKAGADIRAATGERDNGEDEFWRREACAVRGMGMNLMGAFVAFNKMLQVSAKLDMDSTSETSDGGDDGCVPTTRLAPSIPFSCWSMKRHFLLDLVAQADTIQEFSLPHSPFMPAISAVDGRMEFVAALKKHDVATILNHVPALDPYNAEFMLSMLGNMIGYIYMPIIGHVQSLQDGLGAISAAISEMEVATGECIEDFAKAPFIKHAHQLREVAFTLTSLAESVKSSSLRQKFSWRKSAPQAPKKKKNKKKKKQAVAVPLAVIGEQM